MNLLKTKTPSFQPYATGLRRQLLKGRPIEGLLDLHKTNQQMLGLWQPWVKRRRLHPADGFAYGFARDVQILRPDFKPEVAKKRCRGQGVFQDLTARVLRVQQLHFPEMTSYPQVRWLGKFTIRKMAHFNSTKDEIAFSLIFDRLDAPLEILDYLAFHELLHRSVGIRRENGRILAHTPEFRAKERAYPGYSEMDKKLTSYIGAWQFPEGP
ncbi:MAG: hypothetical protein RRB13_07640 [bacterium]|nr:hypothetical protein [bacterium]